MDNKEYRNKEWLKKQFDKYKTPTLVSEKTGYPRTCITRYAIKYNIYNAKYTRDKSNYVDEEYFYNIDSSSKAYFLGFIMADGNIYKRKNGKYQFSIKIKQSDKDILLKFAQEIKFNKDKIIERTETRNKTKTHCAEIKIYNQTFCQHLINHGVIPRKTGKETMPQMKEEFKKDFVRGYIDGDGWIGKNRAQIGFCSSSLSIMESITAYIESAIKIKMNISQQDKGLYVSKIYARKSVYQILKHLYYDGCVSLNRKNKLAKEKQKEIIEDLIGSL